ncbi:MAG TPA: N-acetylglucosamine-6-phosphate deacetylase [Mucilaginibacter sp.]|jgi:N-acetylglucosamine-6-phosphate deacetylase|nr:N-acetylglucosamine-6-phosphate deacetylase [Mucilaginibacter sp.]
MITALHNALIISDSQIIQGKAVLISGEKINAIVPDSDIPKNAERIDLQGAFLAPGLIDLQLYGSGGRLLSIDTDEATLLQMETDLLAQGTTGFFPTISTNTDEVIEQTIKVCRAYREKSKGNFLGLHLEGPFLNPIRRGAHNKDFIKKATLDLVEKWVEMGDGVIKMMTIAPELQDKKVIDYMIDHGIILSSGHSNATYKEGKSFLNNPIQAVTHIYNAMPQMHHRDPGYIPAIFEERPYTSIVPDGIHVDFVMARLAKRELGDKLFFITDSVTETHHGPYQHRFTGDRYVLPDGTLSGSCLTMLKCVENGVNHFGIDLAESVNMASLYPAQLAKLNKGKIAVGYDADFTVFNDSYELRGTFLAGARIN